MTANAKVPTAEQVLGHLRKHDWTQADAEAFVARHAGLVGVATYDDWEDLSREYAEAQE